jgi:hypothetical protein
LECIRVGPHAKRADRMLALDRDLQLLEQKLVQPAGFGLVVIEPGTSYLGGGPIGK